jgi:hypothetical protein
MWMACHSQEEIADGCGESIWTIGRLIADDKFLQLVLGNQTKKTLASDNFMQSVF